MTQCKTTVNNNDESYHDLGKQEQIIKLFKNEMEKLEEEKMHLENELKDFQKKQEHVQQAEEQHVARVKEFNELIQQKKIELTKLDEKLTEFECQRGQLEHELDRQQQKLEDDRNTTKLLNELEHFESEKSYLEDQREILEREKSQLERIQQLKTEVNKFPLYIEKIHGEMELINQKFKNAHEDVQSKENEITNLQKNIKENEQTISNLQRENDRFNFELIRIDHLINRISLIIEMKQNNSKEFEQFKVNLVGDLQQAKKELAEIQKKTHPIIEKNREIEQSIQSLEQNFNKLVKELIEYENYSRISNETIDQLKYVARLTDVSILIFDIS
jgi:chromosome segregation ATPase